MKDVIVVGGGLVGGLTALLLEQGGVKVTVLDAAPILNQDNVLAQNNPRVLALSKATIRLLKHIKVWQKVARHMPYTGMHVWNKNGYGEIEFGQAYKELPKESQWLGSMVEPSILNLAIQQKMQGDVSDYRTQVKVNNIEQISSGWQLTLNDGTVLSTKLLIGADGANSFVRDQAMIDLNILDYKQSAISCGIKTAKPHQYVARQLFLPTGPLAFLPLAYKYNSQYWQSIVWTLPTDYAEEYLKLDDENFKRKLTQSSLHMLGDVEQVTSRVAFPLKARATEHYVKDGLALVGDAAHVIHPLAGQGVNIGCLDAAVLVDVLLTDQPRGSWAHIQTLRRYEYLRKGQNEAMMHSMSIIGWLEKTTFTPFIWARNFGLRQVQNSAFLKQKLMQQASGELALNQTRYVCTKNA